MSAPSTTSASSAAAPAAPRRPARESRRCPVTAEQHVLAVVHALAGLAIDERRRAAAEPRRLFDHDHALAGIRQPDGGAEPAKPAPMTTTSASAGITVSANRPPGLERAAPARPRHPNQRAEDVALRALDALQQLEVDRAHDLGGHEPAGIVGGSARDAREKKTRARAAWCASTARTFGDRTPWPAFSTSSRTSASVHPNLARSSTGRYSRPLR